MGKKSSEWSLSEARSNLADIINLAFDEPQIIVDKKAKEERAVAVIPLRMLEVIREAERKVREVQLDQLFQEMQDSAVSDGFDGKSEILLPRPEPKPITVLSGED